MSIEQLFQIIWFASAVLLIVFVLLHSPKGDGLGSLGGQSQLFTSAKSAEKTLNRITWALGLVFLGTSVILSAGWLPNSPVSNPPQVAPTAAPAPAAPQAAPQSAPPAASPTIPDLPPATEIPSNLGTEE